MISYVTVPQYFENMEEATIGVWLKKEGESVALGQPLCELITEKTTFELAAESTGILRRIAAPEKSIVPVGFTLALIGNEDEPLPDIDAENNALKAQKPKSEPGESALKVPTLNAQPHLPQGHPPFIRGQATAPAAGSRVRATPAARRAAKDKGVDIEAVAAANPGKVISEEDVAKFGE